MYLPYIKFKFGIKADHYIQLTEDEATPMVKVVNSHALE